MRMPWTKLYRAFPELDGVPDADCERYILQVRSQRRIGCVPAIVGFACLVGFGLAMRVFLPLLPRSLVLSLNTGEAIPLVLLIGSVLAGALPALVVRDSLLIRAVRERLALARCTACKHNLIGLPLLPLDQGWPGRGDAVRCPECGRVLVLAQIGLAPADLIPQPRSASEQ